MKLDAIHASGEAMSVKREDVKPIMDMARTHENCAQTCIFVVQMKVPARDGFMTDQWE